MKHECSVVRDLLPLYRENMVSPDTDQYIKQHLASCPSCSGEYAALSSLDEVDRAYTPSPGSDEDGTAVLKTIRKKWKVKKMSIALISAALTLVLALSAVMVYQNVSVVHDFFSPSVTVNLRDIHTDGAWQQLSFEDADTLVFDSIFYMKEVILDANSDSAAALRFCDPDGAVIVDELILHPGEAADLDLLKGNSPYVVSVKADADFLFIRFK